MKKVFLIALILFSIGSAAQKQALRFAAELAVDLNSEFDFMEFGDPVKGDPHVLKLKHPQEIENVVKYTITILYNKEHTIVTNWRIEDDLSVTHTFILKDSAVIIRYFRNKEVYLYVKEL
jgi:hypothetical protein